MNNLLSLDMNPILRTYVVYVGSLLVVGSLVLIVLDSVLKKNVANIWKTYRGWLIMIPTLFITLWVGREATIIGVWLLSMFGFKEFARATGLYRDWWYTGAVYVGITGLTIFTILPDPRHAVDGWYGMFMAMPVYAIALLLTIPIIRNKSEGQLQPVCLAIVGFICMGWMFGHLGYLVNSENFYGYVLYLVFAVELNDISAFTFGKLFGRTKLRSEVSPNKTLEGSLGAVAVSMTLPWLMHFSFPHFGTTDLLLTGVIVGVGGQLGDLTISFIKRDLGVKDMGVVIPGHGGILDRVDSLIFVAPLFFHMIRWFHDL